MVHPRATRGHYVLLKCCFGSWPCLFVNIGQFGVFWFCVAGPERNTLAVHEYCVLCFCFDFSERNMVWDGRGLSFHLKWPRMGSARMPKFSFWQLSIEQNWQSATKFICSGSVAGTVKKKPGGIWLGLNTQAQVCLFRKCSNNK